MSDGLRGLTEAIKRVFPGAKHQLYQTHLLRRSLALVKRVDQVQVVEELKSILHAPTEEEAYRKFEDFSKRWEGKYPQLVRMWRRSLRGALAHRALLQEAFTEAAELSQEEEVGYEETQ